MDVSHVSFTCPVCGMTSYNPNDVREGYCGHCHDWTGEESASDIRAAFVRGAKGVTRDPSAKERK